MKRMSVILFIITDDNINKSSLVKSINLARKNNAHIKFLRIYDSYTAIAESLNITTNKTIEIFCSNLEKSIGAFSEELKDVTYTFDIREGIWFVEAIREAVKIKSDLIILSEPQKREVIFESDAMHVIRKSPIPVWLIRNNTPTACKKVLVAVDIDINDKVKSEIITKCMNLAARLIDSCDEPKELIVVNCWSLYNEWYLRNVASNISSIQIDDRVNRERSLHEAWFNSFNIQNKEFNISKSCCVQGDPEEIIPKLVKEENIGTLVMGTVSKLFIKGLYITSRAEAILNGVSCSVLTVKPDNFSSPVV